MIYVYGMFHFIQNKFSYRYVCSFHSSEAMFYTGKTMQNSLTEPKILLTYPNIARFSAILLVIL